MKKVFIFFALFLLFSSNSPEEDFITSLKSKFDLYLKSIQTGDLYVTFNQTKYVTGDTVAMSIQYSRNLDKAPAKQIVYVQLLSNEGIESWHARVLLKKGKAISYFVLPPQFKPGAYIFVAFTEQIRQINPNLAFSTPFFIADKTTLKFSSDKKDVAIYSECHASVNAIPNHYILAGEPLSILNIKNGNTIIKTLQLDSAGIAELEIIPQKGDSLFAESTYGTVKSFPVRQDEGFQLHIVDARMIEINIHPKTLNGGNKVYFILAGNLGITFYKEVNLKEKSAIRFSIPDEAVQDGLCEAILIDVDYRIWARRNIYLKKIKTANVSVAMATANLNTNETTLLNIKVEDNQGNSIHSMANISVINNGLISPVEKQLFNNLSRLNQNAIRNDQSFINWNQIFHPSPVKRVDDKIYLTGRIFLTENNQPVADSTHVLFFLKKSLLGYDTYTNAKGEFRAPLIFDFYGEEELFYCATYKGRDLTNVSFQFNETFPALAKNKSKSICTESNSDPYYQYTLKKKIVDNSYSFFQKKTNEEEVDYNTIIEDELQGADIVFKTADYVLFPTMAELVKEALKSVDHRVVKGRDIVRLYTTNDIPNRQTSPLFVIDGAVSKDPKQFLSLNPENVITIKIIKDSKKLLRFGALSKNGVIIVKTKSVQSKPETLKPLEGFLRTYEIKDYKKDNNRIPDLRASLLWKPQINLTEETTPISFKTSNDIGDFTLVISGFTGSGNPFYHSQPLKVVYRVIH